MNKFYFHNTEIATVQRGPSARSMPANEARAPIQPQEITRAPPTPTQSPREWVWVGGMGRPCHALRRNGWSRVLRHIICIVYYEMRIARMLF